MRTRIGGKKRGLKLIKTGRVPNGSGRVNLDVADLAGIWRTIGLPTIFGFVVL